MNQAVGVGVAQASTDSSQSIKNLLFCEMGASISNGLNFIAEIASRAVLHGNEEGVARVDGRVVCVDKIINVLDYILVFQTPELFGLGRIHFAESHVLHSYFLER